MFKINFVIYDMILCILLTSLLSALHILLTDDTRQHLISARFYLPEYVMLLSEVSRIGWLLQSGE